MPREAAVVNIDAQTETAIQPPRTLGRLSPEVARSFQSTAFLDAEAKRNAGGTGLARLAP
jgi:hypothetical protein